MKKKSLEDTTNLELLLELYEKTQADLSKATKITAPTISRIATGKHHSANVGHAISIARYFGLIVEQLYSRDFVMALCKGGPDGDDNVLIEAMTQGFKLLAPEEKRQFVSSWFSRLQEVNRAKANDISSS